MKVSRIQLEALDQAVRLFAPAPPPMTQAAQDDLMQRVLGTATVFARWLGNPVISIRIVPDIITWTQGGSIPHNTIITGGKVQLPDNQQVSLSVEAQAAKGFATNEAGDVVVTWNTSDASVVNLQPAADGLSCEAVAGNPGSALVTVSDGTNSGSLAFDVTAGPAVALTVNAGTPEDQPPAP